MPEMTRREILKILGMAGPGYAAYKLGSKFAYASSEQNPRHSNEITGINVSQEGMGQEQPLENYLPDIYAKTDKEGADKYVTSGCMNDNSKRLIMHLERGSGKTFSRLTVREVGSDTFEKLKGLDDQEALTAAFGKGSYFRVYRIFGSNLWGDGTDYDGFEMMVDGSYKNSRINTKFDYAERKLFTDLTRCLKEALETAK